MKATFTNPILLALTGLVLVFLAVTWFLQGQTLIVSTNAFRLVVAAAVGVAWLPGALYYMWQGRPIRRGYLIIGICGSWLSEAAIGLVVVLRRFYRPDVPAWLGDEAIVFLIFISIGCGIMHLTAGSMEAGEDKVPTRGWIITGLIVAAAIATAVVFVFLLGDVQAGLGGGVRVGMLP